MLILTRKIGETVIIGEDIHCTVLEFKGKQVRLGFDAPKLMPINRKEIHDRINLETQESQSVNDDAHASIIDGLVAKFKRQQLNQNVH